MMDEERRLKIIAEMEAIVIERSPYGDDDPGLTTREWAEAWGVSPKTAGARLRNFWEAGIIVSGRKREKRMDGTLGQTPVYRAKSK
jgi:hypothetical protein